MGYVPLTCGKVGPAGVKCPCPAARSAAPDEAPAGQAQGYGEIRTRGGRAFICCVNNSRDHFPPAQCSRSRKLTQGDGGRLCSARRLPQGSATYSVSSTEEKLSGCACSSTHSASFCLSQWCSTMFIVASTSSLWPASRS